MFCHEGHGQLKTQFAAGPLLNHTCLQANRRDGRAAFQQVIETLSVITDSLPNTRPDLTVTCTEHWGPNFSPFPGEAQNPATEVPLAIFQVTPTYSMSGSLDNSMELPYLLSHRETVETKSETSRLFPPRDNSLSCAVSVTQMKVADGSTSFLPPSHQKARLKFEVSRKQHGC